MKYFTCLLALLIFIPKLTFAQESFYTPLDLAKCKTIESSENDPNAEIDYFTSKCPGRDGYDVIVTGGDLRSWVILEKKGKLIFDSRIDVFENAPGGFPYVSGGMLEWRYGKDKKLSALIFRISGQVENTADGKMLHAKDISHLIIIRALSDGFCFLGKSKTNDEARIVADGPQTCKKRNEDALP